MMSLWIMLAAMTGMLILWVRVVGVNFSLSSMMMGGLLSLHGPAYVYYTRVWGPGHGIMRELYTLSNSVTPKQLEMGMGANEMEAATKIPAETVNFFDQVLSVANGRNVIAELDIALALLFLSFCIGLVLFDRLKGNTAAQMRERIDTWGKAVIPQISPQAMPWIAVFLAASACAAFTVALQEDQIGRVLMYFQSNAGEFEKITMRRMMGGSPSYLYNLTLAAVLPLLAIWALILTPQSPRFMAPIALLLVALVLLGKLASLSKAPPAFFCMQLMALAVIWHKLRLTAKTLLLIGSGTLILLMGMSFVANVNLGNGFNSLVFLFYRIFMIPNESLLEYFSAIPSVIDHTAGLDNRWLASSLQIDALSATYTRVADVFRSPKGLSTTNAMFLGDAWAAFSWWGVLIIGLIAGFGLRTIDTFLILQVGKSAATVAALTAGLFGVFVALSTAFQTALLTGGLLILVPFAMVASKLEVRTPE